MASKQGSSFDLVERSASYLNLDEDFVPLDGYKTNDTFHHKPDEEKRVRVNTRVVGCGLIAVLFFVGIIAAVVWGADSRNNRPPIDFDHNKVRLGVKGTKCALTRNCTAACSTIVVEHLLGCCSVNSRYNRYSNF